MLLHKHKMSNYVKLCFEFLSPSWPHLETTRQQVKSCLVFDSVDLLNNHFARTIGRQCVQQNSPTHKAFLGKKVVTLISELNATWGDHGFPSPPPNFNVGTVCFGCRRFAGASWSATLKLGVRGCGVGLPLYQIVLNLC